MDQTLNPTQPGKPLLKVIGLSKIFEDYPALSDVNFDVLSGEILGLIGPNGAGKTTLIECLAGLLAADMLEVQCQESSLPIQRRNGSHGRRWKMKARGLIAACTLGLCGASFEKDRAGAEPSAFVPVVGVWRIGNDGKNKVLVVDGGKWKQGQPSAGLADKARALYGERYAEFLDNVKSYAYFPLAVAKDVDDFKNGEISFRFKGMAGRIDQGAGIVFNLKTDGDYLVLRANALENNLVLFKYVQGKRSSVEWIRNAPTETLKWHELKVVVKEKHIQGYLNGKLLLEHDWSEPISGRVGVWSKADSVVYFDDFAVKPSLSAR